MKRADKSLTYIIGAYPGLTTTFIDREIESLRQLGARLRVLSIRRPWTRLSPEQVALQQGVTYLLPVRWAAFTGGHARFALTQPRMYFGLLFYLLTRPHPSFKARAKTLLHFAEGVYAAHLLRSDPGSHLHAHFIDRSATVALVAGRLLHIPYSVTAHATDIYVNPVMLPEKLAGAKFVATCTGYNQAYLLQFGHNLFNHKLLTIYHGLDTSRYQRRNRRTRTAPNGRPVILSVGQLKDRKGFRYLIEACRVLRNRGIDFECRIVGEGPQRGELEDLIRRLDLTERVILYGAQTQEEVIAQYEQAALFTLPAVLSADGDRDGIPNVILEALSMELPVVSTRHSGVPEVVEDGVNGLLVAPKDVQALADALARLIGDPELCRQFGSAGRQTVVERFDPLTNARKLLDAFNQDSHPADDSSSDRRLAAIGRLNGKQPHDYRNGRQPAPGLQGGNQSSAKKPEHGALFLVWSAPTHGSSRSRFLARELGLGAPYYLSFGSRRGLVTAPLRYLVQGVQTLRLLFQKRPRVVIVQSPPSIAVLTAALYAALTGSRYIVDAHSDAFQRKIWTRPRWLYRLVARRAAVTIVTDHHFRQMIERWGAKAMVMRSPVTWFPQGEVSLDGGFNVTVVNSFSADEPLEEVLRAAAALPDVRFYITGKTKNAGELLAQAPKNVKFTGFLPEKQYYGLLKASHAVMSLTTRDHTFQCGACESLSLERPILTSHWPLLQEYFCLGTVHVNNTAEGIRQGVEKMQQEYDRYRLEIVKLRELRAQEWQQRIDELKEVIDHG